MLLIEAIIIILAVVMLAILREIKGYDLEQNQRFTIVSLWVFRVITGIFTGLLIGSVFLK